MQRFLPVLVLFLYAAPAVLHAQYHNQRLKSLKANSVWVFGRSAGLNFNSGGPVPFQADFNNNASLREGCASLADTGTGILLFYSGGGEVRNGNQGLMPLGSGLQGNRGSTTQGVCIVPFINDPNKYYLFSLNGTSDVSIPSGTLFYSVIDMNLNGGLGDIVPGLKNIVLFSNSGASELGEAMIAIPGNNCDIWLVVHHAYANIFRAYHITAAGVDPNPVISVTGTVTDAYAYYIGGMAVSPNRKMIAMCSAKYDALNPGGVDLCRFDVETGTISNAIPVGPVPPLGAYVPAFSPDSRKLYLTDRDTVWQYNLRVYDEASISNSRVNLGLLPNLSKGSAYMRLYKDIIYVNTPTGLGTISHPDFGGLDCDYEAVAVPFLPGTEPLAMLPNDVVFDYKPYDTIPDLYQDTSICFTAAQPSAQLRAKPGFSQYIWEDGTAGMERTITGTGRYWVYYMGSCNRRVDTFYVHEVTDTFRRIYLDTTICLDSLPFPQISLKAAPGFTQYLWDNGTAGPDRSIHQPGKYWVQYLYSCNIRVDTFILKQSSFLAFGDLDTVVCEQRFPFTLSAAFSADRYLWSDESGADHFSVSAPGRYWLRITKDGCSLTDSILITSKFCPCSVFMPNAFSPNGDGLNDYYRPSIGQGCVPHGYQFRIYNRWGQMVYSSASEFDQGWNGIGKGGEADVGTYFYELRFKSRFLDKEYYEKGELILVR